MHLSPPRFAILDTATISYAAENQGETNVREFMAVLRSGDWIPFLTYHHLEELASHANESVFLRRFEFLGALPHLAYLNTCSEKANVGSLLEIRDLEIGHLLSSEGATHTDILTAVQSKVRSGFRSGKEFLRDNIEWWRLFRLEFAEVVSRQKAEIANVVHFPTVDLEARIPALGANLKVRSEREAAFAFGRMARVLAEQIRQSGDCRGIDPREIAESLMRESYEELVSDLKERDLFEAVLDRFGVRRERLPRNARIKDVGYEGVFVGQMGVHARRLLTSRDEILQRVRKENLPSWVLWQETDYRLKKLPKAEIGNLNDKMVVPFGLYVDLLNVDKRIADILRQMAKTHDLATVVHKRIPSGRGFAGLLATMKLR